MGGALPWYAKPTRLLWHEKGEARAQKWWISLPVPGVCSGRARPDRKHAWWFDPFTLALTPKVGLGRSEVLGGPRCAARASLGTCPRNLRVKSAWRAARPLTKL